MSRKEGKKKEEQEEEQEEEEEQQEAEETKVAVFFLYTGSSRRIYTLGTFITQMFIRMLSYHIYGADGTDKTIKNNTDRKIERSKDLIL
jgi:23S rRNA pseudoU1915 N3-methylase RlmH